VLAPLARDKPFRVKRSGLLPILLGDEDGDHLRLAAAPGTSGDPGWIDVEAAARTGGLAGRVAGALEPEALAAFRGAIAALAASPRGRAALVSPDGFLAVRLLGDGFGHFDARCELRDLAAIGSRLELTLPVNVRDLPAILAALDALVAAAPGP
jgi:hypothetical protein